MPSKCYRLAKHSRSGGCDHAREQQQLIQQGSEVISPYDSGDIRGALLRTSEQVGELIQQLHDLDGDKTGCSMSSMKYRKIAQ